MNQFAPQRHLVSTSTLCKTNLVPPHLTYVQLDEPSIVLKMATNSFSWYSSSLTWVIWEIIMSVVSALELLTNIVFLTLSKTYSLFLFLILLFILMSRCHAWVTSTCCKCCPCSVFSCAVIRCSGKGGVKCFSCPVSSLEKFQDSSTFHCVNDQHFKAATEPCQWAPRLQDLLSSDLH